MRLEIESLNCLHNEGHSSLRLGILQFATRALVPGRIEVEECLLVRRQMSGDPEIPRGPSRPVPLDRFEFRQVHDCVSQNGWQLNGTERDDNVADMRQSLTKIDNACVSCHALFNIRIPLDYPDGRFKIDQGSAIGLSLPKFRKAKSSSSMPRNRNSVHTDRAMWVGEYSASVSRPQDRCKREPRIRGRP